MDQTELEISEEGLSIQQRLKRARLAKINRVKLAYARKRHAKRAAAAGRIHNRATKTVRGSIKKKLAKGKSLKDMGPAQRQELERKANRPHLKALATRYVIRQKPLQRKLERERNK